LSIKAEAIREAIDATLFSVCRHTRVGAALYSSTQVYKGYNYENRCQKGYHAEEMAVLKAHMSHVDPKDLIGLIVTFSSDDIDSLTFCCGHCRQIVWEYTLNPNLIVSEVNFNGKIIMEKTLGELYPYPYPRAAKANVSGMVDILK